MTFILRLLSVVSTFLMIVFFAMPIMMFGYGTSPIRDTIASIVFIVIAILAMRCTRWLWRKQRFWTEINSLSEVAAFGCLLLLWPLEAFLEHRTVGLMKVAVQLTSLLLAFSVYVFIRRYDKAKTISIV